MAVDPIKMTPVERAMTWERMTCTRLSDAERQRILAGGDFIPPGAETELRDFPLLSDSRYHPDWKVDVRFNAIINEIAEIIASSTEEESWLLMLPVFARLQSLGVIPNG